MYTYMYALFIFYMEVVPSCTTLLQRIISCHLRVVIVLMRLAKSPLLISVIIILYYVQ